MASLEWLTLRALLCNNFINLSLLRVGRHSTRGSGVWHTGEYTSIRHVSIAVFVSPSCPPWRFHAVPLPVSDKRCPTAGPGLHPSYSTTAC